jgi:hypothetical protein
MTIENQQTEEEWFNDKNRFIDLEPLLIYLPNGNKWTNPFIETYAAPRFDEVLSDTVYEGRVFRIYFTNSKNEKMMIVFASNSLEYLESRWYDDFKKDPNTDLFTSPYINIDEIVSIFDLIFYEDVYAPSPWEKDGRMDKQLYFTRFGKKIRNFWDKGITDIWMSLDVVLCKDGKEWEFES